MPRPLIIALVVAAGLAILIFGIPRQPRESNQSS